MEASTEGAANVNGTPVRDSGPSPGLKAGAISYISNVVIGVASTAPALSLALTIGFIVGIGGMGVHMPPTPRT